MRVRTTIASVMCIALSACNSASNDPASAPSIVQETKSNPPAPTDAVFVQTLPSPDFPTPDTTTRGSFELRDGCLIFVTGEGNFLAVVPSGSKLVASNRVTFSDGRQIRIGQSVVIKGAESEFGRASERPSACPAKAILIGGMEK